MGRRLLLLPLATLLLPQPSSAQKALPADLNRQIASNRIVEDAALSPDGKTVASMIFDPTTAGGRSHVWILSPKADPRQITGKPGQDGEETAPIWTADGRAIVYLERSGAQAVVARTTADGARTETLALFRSSGAAATGGWGGDSAGRTALVVRGFSLSASGVLAVWASDPTDAAARSARKDDQHLFGQRDPIRLYIVEDGKPVREVALPQDVRGASWSDDGRHLLVVTKPVSDDLGAPNRLWVVAGDEAAKEVEGTGENIQTASWLPDGRIAYFARCIRNAPIVCRDLFVQALDGSKPRDLTDGIEGSLITGLDNVATAGPLVTASGDILVTVARGFDQQVARIDPADGRTRWIASLPAVVRTVGSNVARTGFALLAADRGGVTTVQVADAGLHSHTPVRTPLLQPADWTPLQARHVQWPSDTLAIDGLLYLPPGASAEKPAPLVVDVHGGPAGRFDDSDYPLVRLLLAKGWAVLHVNPRGSFGYGVGFLASLQDDLGGGDYRDIMTGVDAVLRQAPVDRDRMALIGYSYGASMTTVVLGKTERFKALVAVAPVVDQISEYGTEGSSWYDRWYFGQPWRELDRAWRQSSLSLIVHAKTPLLLLHGEADPVNPVGQSFELYRALRQEGTPVELMLFPRETHLEIGRNFYGFPSVEPQHGVALRQKVLDFLGDAFTGRPHPDIAGAPNP